MAEVAAVLHDLQPVARQTVRDDLAKAAGLHEEIPLRQKRRRQRPEIRPDEAAHRLHRIAGNPHAIFERAVRRLERLLHAAACAVEEPAVVAAANAVRFRNAGGEARHAVRTTLPDETEIAAAVAVEHEVFAEDAHVGDRVLGQQRFGIDGVPVAAHEFAAGRSGADARERFVLGLGQHRGRIHPLRVARVPMRFERVARVATMCCVVAGLTIARGAADSGPVRIGVIYAYSANAASPLGPRLDAAVGAWFKEHGDSVAGRKIELIRRDEGGVNPENAKRLAQELVVQQHVDLLMGLIFTPNAVAVGEISTQAKVPLMILNATTSGILAKNPYAMRDSYTTAQVTAPLATWARRHGAKTAYVLFQDYGPGVDAGTTFEKTFEAAGGKIIGEARVPFTSLDYAAYVQRIKDAKPDVLYVFLNSGGGGPPFLRDCANAGLQKSGIKILVHG
ncbi:MAG TPA: ABC transporter substrate-binding protein, partial [Gemmatimonadaceae bacterium]|nr:ABC transporter substrate-binding protein [Gemmatimonadaceae bacterium]